MPLFWLSWNPPTVSASCGPKDIGLRKITPINCVINYCPREGKGQKAIETLFFSRRHFLFPSNVGFKCKHIWVVKIEKFHNLWLNSMRGFHKVLSQIINHAIDIINLIENLITFNLITVISLKIYYILLYYFCFII